MESSQKTNLPQGLNWNILPEKCESRKVPQRVILGQGSVHDTDKSWRKFSFCELCFFQGGSPDAEHVRLVVDHLHVLQSLHALSLLLLVEEHLVKDEQKLV